MLRLWHFFWLKGYWKQNGDNWGSFVRGKCHFGILYIVLCCQDPKIQLLFLFLFFTFIYNTLLFKGLRPVLEGFVVTMHEGACKTGSQIWRTVRTSPSALWQQTRQIGLNHDYNMTFSILPLECKFSSIKIRISCSKREPFRVLLPLLRHVVPLNDRNCRLTIPVVRGRCARDALPHAFHIGVS